MLIGRVGASPEVKHLDDGKSLTYLRIVTNNWYINKNGESKSETEWHRVVSFSKLAETLAKHAKTGMLMHIEGSLKTRTWINERSENMYITEIHVSSFLFLSNKEDAGT